jgi:sialate O-acetylesterase
MSNHIWPLVALTLIASTMTASGFGPTPGNSNGLLSNVLGSHMVLQRSRPTIVWGFLPPNVSVTTMFYVRPDYVQTLGPAFPDANGTWRQEIPATEAGGGPHMITFQTSEGETAELNDILFGDVFVCGGESNMAYSLGPTTNATAEVAAAANYTSIRLFTVGQNTRSLAPLNDLRTIREGWTLPNASAMDDGQMFGQFSSVCWFFGRQVFEGLGGKVPIGLISNSWPDTSIVEWAPSSSLSSCGHTPHPPQQWNAMVHPYTVGPMALTGFAWYQGATDTRPAQVKAYACLFPAMISAWREAFKQPTAFFGFVQLSTWCHPPLPRPGQCNATCPYLAPVMRQTQMEAFTKLTKVGFATNADHGDGCNIHPPDKQYCGKRLGDSALGVQYGQHILWQGPHFESQVFTDSPVPTATIKLAGVSSEGVRADAPPANAKAGPSGQAPFNCSTIDAADGTAGGCAWGALRLADGSWVNATITATGPAEVTLTADADGMWARVGARTGLPTASSYGWGAVPMMSVYDKATELPLLPFNTSFSVDSPFQVGMPLNQAGESSISPAGPRSARSS